MTGYPIAIVLWLLVVVLVAAAVAVMWFDGGDQ